MQVIETCHVCGKQNLYVGKIVGAKNARVCMNCFTQPDSPFGYSDSLMMQGFHLIPHDPTPDELNKSHSRDELVSKMRHQFKIRYNLFEADKKREEVYGATHNDQINIGDIAEGKQDDRSKALREQARIDKQAIINLQMIQYWPVYDIIQI